MKKAIFLDIDGTLIDTYNGINKMTDRVKKSIKDLQAAGNYVFIATGRPYAFLDQDILDFGFDGFVLVNGAHIIVKGKTIHYEALEKSFVKEAVENFEKLNIEYILEGEEYSYIKDNYKKMRRFYEEVGIVDTYLCNEFDLNNIDICKMEMIYEDKNGHDYCMSIIDDSNGKYDYCQSIDISVFEIYAKKNSKGTAILKVVDYLGINLEDSYAFGDGKNDIEMIMTAGCGIAMGNAEEEVKKCADRITDTVGNDGIAKAVEEFIL